MKPAPKISDFVSTPSNLNNNIWHLQSLREDIINPRIADEFYRNYANQLSEGIKDCLVNGSSLDDLIDRISDMASNCPAIDWENQVKPEEIKTETALIKWRKDTFWTMNVRYISESISAKAVEAYEKANLEYAKYENWYYSLTPDEQRTIDKSEEFGLL
ncbi:MAG: hypothetical protein EBX50_07715 [Chitinophagia bacterium]|nr:hypothetical protein [Chitinophagia bacterium]